MAAVSRMWRLIYTLWLVELGLVIVIWLGVPLVVPRSGDVDAAVNLIALIFYAAGLAEIAFGWWMNARALAPDRLTGARSTEEALGRIVGSSLVAVTLAATPAFLGLVLYLALGHRAGLGVLCVLSLIGLAILRPRREQWQELLMVTRIDANRPA